MFRRSRADLDLPGVRRHRFGVVSITRPERRLQRLLERYSRLVWRDAPGDADAARARDDRAAKARLVLAFRRC